MYEVRRYRFEVGSVENRIYFLQRKLFTLMCRDEDMLGLRVGPGLEVRIVTGYVG